MFLFSTATPKIRIETKYKEITVKAGEKIKVDATITGSPAPTVTVAQEKEEVKPSARVRIDSEKGTKAKMTLTIDKCERNDLGEYTLTAANDLGSDSTSIKITIVGRLCFSS